MIEILFTFSHTKNCSIKNEKRIKERRKKGMKMCVNTWRRHKTETFQLLLVNQVNVLIVLNAERRILFFFLHNFITLVGCVRQWLSDCAIRCVSFLSPFLWWNSFIQIWIWIWFNRNQWTRHTHTLLLNGQLCGSSFQHGWNLFRHKNSNKKSSFWNFSTVSFCNDTMFDVRCSMLNRSIVPFITFVILIELRDIFVWILSTFSHAFHQRNKKPILDRWIWIFW